MTVGLFHYYCPPSRKKVFIVEPVSAAAIDVFKDDIAESTWGSLCYVGNPCGLSSAAEIPNVMKEP